MGAVILCDYKDASFPNAFDDSSQLPAAVGSDDKGFDVMSASRRAFCETDWGSASVLSQHSHQALQDRADVLRDRGD